MKSKHASCLICGSYQTSPLKGYEAAHLCKCNRCAFVFSQGIPTPEELEKHYEGYGRNDYF